MTAWVFAGNDDDFPVTEYVKINRYIYWATPIPAYQREIAVGDSAFIWRQQKGSDDDKGLIAIGRVAEACTHESTVRYPYLLWRDQWKTPPKTTFAYKTGISISDARLNVKDAMLDSSLLKRFLPEFLPLRMAQPTMHRLTDATARQVIALWEGISTPVDDEEDVSYAEGKRVYRLHFRYERDKKLVNDAKRDFASRNGGKLFCENCKFCFSERYKELGSYIEVHHLRPLKDSMREIITRLEDVILLCANCHRAAHRGPVTYNRKDLLEKISML